MLFVVVSHTCTVPLVSINVMQTRVEHTIKTEANAYQLLLSWTMVVYYMWLAIQLHVRDR